jgi:hypothetical protein
MTPRPALSNTGMMPTSTVSTSPAAAEDFAE